MARWAHLKGKYPDLPEDTSPRTTEILGATDELRDMARMLRAAKQRRTELNKEARVNKGEIDSLEHAIRLWLEAKNLDSATVAGVHYTLVIAPKPNITDTHLVSVWGLEHVPDDMRIGTAALQRLVNEAIEANEPLPPGLELFMKTDLSVTQA